MKKSRESRVLLILLALVLTLSMLIGLLASRKRKAYR